MIIKGFENYSIFKDGVVISHKRKHPRWGTVINKDLVMKPSKTGKDKKYLKVRLTNLYGYSKMFSVHRLVAEHFIQNPNSLPQVNHIDGDTFNNNAENLEWCDNSYNQKHAYANGLKRADGEYNGMYGKKGAWKNKRGDKHNKSKRVVQLDLDGNIIKGFESATLAGEEVGGSAGNISKVCRGLANKSSGYKWIFATEEHKFLFNHCIKD